MKLFMPELLALLIWSVLALFCNTSCAKENSDIIMPVRIAISGYDNYAFYDENGHASGAETEFAYKIGQYANLSVEVVPITDAVDSFAALDNGDVDVLFDMFKSEAREKKYLFSEYPAGSTPTSVYVRNDDSRFVDGDNVQVRELLFGVEQDSYVAAIFRKWCQKQGFVPKLKEFRGSKDINAALDAGEIDAGVYSAEFPIAGYRTILKFSPLPYYCMFRKSDRLLKERFDRAMAQLLTDEPLCKDRLIKKYLAPQQKGIVSLTREETAYVQTHPVLTIAVLKHDEPYFSIDRNGSPRGVLPDYYEKLALLTGLKFRFRRYETQQEALDAVTGGEADILGLFSGGLLAAHEQRLRLTSAYMAVNMVMITLERTDPEAIRKIAVKERYRNLILRNLVPGINATPVSYNNASECFSALREYRVQAVVCGFPSATWLINQTYSSAYSVSPLSSVSLDLCAAVAYENSALCSILNKSIDAAPFSFSGYITKNTLTEGNWRGTVAQIPPSWIVMITSLLLLLVFSLVFALFVIRRRQRERVAVLQSKASVEREKAKLESIEKVNEEKDRFFSSISHDMRTPLNAILGFSELAVKEDMSPKLSDYLAKIQLSGGMLLALINDTLTMSKINSGKLSLRPESFNTQDLISQITVPIGMMAEKQHIHFVVDNDWPKKMIQVDRLNFQKIILNLLTNAVKYTPDGGHVTLTLSGVEKDGGLDTVICIKDDGIGMSREFLPHIYEPFAQEDRMTGVFGTGLGLSIAKRFVEMMSGTIDVSSTEGQGTTFVLHIRFPFGQGTPDMKKQKAMSQAKLSGHRILLCEDNALNTEIASAMLSSMGVTVTAVENGRLGLERFAQSAPGTYSAILMDMRMPVMDGMEATRAIRALKRPDAKVIPIIGMSADVFEADKKKRIECGISGHLDKPFSMADIFDVLGQLLHD